MNKPKFKLVHLYQIPTKVFFLSIKTIMPNNTINIKTIIAIILFIVVSTNSYSQSGAINLINCSSNYSNTIQYNTGEIFVVYNFGTNTTTSKEAQSSYDETILETNSQIKLYPNPTTGVVNYSLPNDFVFENVEVYDQNQKSIYFSVENTQKISLENLPSGTYYIIFNKNNQHNYKIIKR